MKVIVKNGFCEKLFFDESGKQFAVLRNTRLFGPEKAVIGEDKCIKYESDIETLPYKPAGENRQYVLKQGGVVIATAEPVYSDGADHFALPKPPHPIGLNIQTKNGNAFHVDYKEKDKLEIHSPHGASLSLTLSFFKPQEFEIPNESNPYLIAGIYALICYMLHEDDSYPV